MRIWYAIRRPIGYTIIITFCSLGLILLHALPIVLVDALLGL